MFQCCGAVNMVLSSVLAEAGTESGAKLKAPSQCKPGICTGLVYPALSSSGRRKVGSIRLSLVLLVIWAAVQ